MVDLRSLHSGPHPYLGWYIEGEAKSYGHYWWYAHEDKGGGEFRIHTQTGDFGAPSHLDSFEQARSYGLRVAKGKIQLDSWSLSTEYEARPPSAPRPMPLSEIHRLILRSLYRLHETGFPDDVTIDLDGVAAELGVERRIVDRAVEFLFDSGYVDEYGTLGRNRRTGDIWITARGIAQCEASLAPSPTPFPIASGASDETGASSPRDEEQKLVDDPSRVAVVYGRNEVLQVEMFALLRALGLKPVEWTRAIQETGSAAPYVGDVVDRLFEYVQAAVVLWTGDDQVVLREELRGDKPAAWRLQPRPNVILEAGMALSRLPTRTVIVQVGDVDDISDLAGRHIVHLRSVEDRLDLAQRLEAAGCPVDRSGTDWLRTGTFASAPWSPPSHVPTGHGDTKQDLASIKAELRMYRDRLSRGYDDEPEVQYGLFQVAADFIEDELGIEERNLFWSDEGLDMNLDPFNRRYLRVSELLDRLHLLPRFSK